MKMWLPKIRKKYRWVITIHYILGHKVNFLSVSQEIFVHNVEKNAMELAKVQIRRKQIKRGRFLPALYPASCEAFT